WSRVSHSSNIGKDITMVFANGSHDLTAARFEDDEIEVTVVFGNGLIILPDDINFVFQPTAVFGSTNIPSHKDVEGRKVVVDATAVFGRLDFQFKPSTRATEEKASPSADSLSTKETNF
ncbi:MAG: hypothetical protein PHI68_01070, partial [Candidatus Cloacimonetes bacterium]|nr:hypothetical protein [Candidatus Cloacimonadota bacterium]